MLPICRTRRKGGWGCCGSTVVTTKTRTRGTRTRGWTVTTKKKMNSRWESSKLLSIHQMQFYAISDWIWFIALFIHPPTHHLFSPVWDNQPAKSSSVSQSKRRRRRGFAVCQKCSTRNGLGILFEIEHLVVPSKSSRNVKCLADVFRKVEKGGEPRMGR